MAAKGTMSIETADDLIKNLLILSRIVGHVLEGKVVEAAVDQPLSPSKVQIFRLLGARGSQTSTQIARFLSVSKPAVTQLVDSMVQRKMIVRRPAKHDRREVDLQLTDKGKGVYRAIRGQQRQFLRNASRKAGGGGDRWVKALSEVTAALTKDGGPFEGFCLQCGTHADDNCVLNGSGTECQFHTGDKARSSSGKRQVAPKKTAKRTSSKRGKA